MNAEERDSILARLDERMAWLIEEHKAHRQDYRELLQTVNSHGKWLHVGKLMFIIAGGAILARDYMADWINNLRH